MKDFCIGIIIGFGLVLVIIVLIFCSYFGSIKAITSSHIEEMYHRQLVITLDSTLDSRFGSGCCEKVINNDSVSVPQTLFHNHSSIKMME